MTTFLVPGIPAPQGSKSAFVRGGRAVLVESSKGVGPWREAVAWSARSAVNGLITGPVELHIEFIMPRPKAWGKKRNDPMVQRPDLDKTLRSTCDGLTGSAYMDDSQVVKITASKRRAGHDEATGALITIKESI